MMSKILERKFYIWLFSHSTSKEMQRNSITRIPWKIKSELSAHRQRLQQGYGDSPHAVWWSVLLDEVQQNFPRSRKYPEWTHFQLQIDKTKADQNCLVRALCGYVCQSEGKDGTESFLSKILSGQAIGIHSLSRRVPPYPTNMSTPYDLGGDLFATIQFGIDASFIVIFFV